MTATDFCRVSIRNNTSDMQGLVWGEPELAHEYDIDVENTE